MSIYDKNVVVSQGNSRLPWVLWSAVFLLFWTAKGIYLLWKMWKMWKKMWKKCDWISLCWLNTVVLCRNGSKKVQSKANWHVLWKFFFETFFFRFDHLITRRYCFILYTSLNTRCFVKNLISWELIQVFFKFVKILSVLFLRK